jgi:hypothetical protein
LAWVLHKTPLPAIVSSLTSADLPLLLGGLLLNFAARLAAAERTLVISRGFGAWISRWQTIETLFISNFYALLSPGPILSGVVTVYRYRGYGASVSASVGSLLASRAIECMLFVALGAACLLWDPHVELAAVRYPLILAAIALGAAALAMLYWWWSHRRRNPAALSPVTDRTTGLMAGLRAAWNEVMRRGPALALQAAVPATVQVVLSGAAVELLARSVGIELTLVTAIWVTAAVYLVVLLPISVAGVGVREVTLTNALGLLGVDASLAVALSILLFLDPLINALIGGALQLRSSLLRVPGQA